MAFGGHWTSGAGAPRLRTSGLGTSGWGASGLRTSGLGAPGLGAWLMMLGAAGREIVGNCVLVNLQCVEVEWIRQRGSGSGREAERKWRYTQPQYFMMASSIIKIPALGSRKRYTLVIKPHPLVTPSSLMCTGHRARGIKAHQVWGSSGGPVDYVDLV